MKSMPDPEFLKELEEAVNGRHEAKNGLLFDRLPSASKVEARLTFRAMLGMHASTLATALEELPVAALGPEAPVLRLLLCHHDELVRVCVVERLPESKRTASLVSENLLCDKSVLVRLTALRALMETGKLIVETVLRVAKSDTSPVVRAKAAGLAVITFRIREKQMDLIRLSICRNKLASAMALSYLDEAVEDSLLPDELIDHLRQNFARIPPGIDPETRATIESIRERIAL